MVWLPDGEQRFIICLPVSTQYRLLAGRQTDGRLATALCIASCVKN